MSAGTPAEQRARAFSCSVSQVDNLILPDGRIVTQWRPKQTNKTPGGEIVMIDDLELNNFSGEVIEEIGGVAHAYSFLGPRAAGNYALPPTLPLLSEIQQISPPAERPPSGSVMSSEGRKAASTKTGDPLGGEDTVAHAGPVRS
jgi:hypothetical protein